LRAGDALIVVDLQIDFCPGGALPIETLPAQERLPVIIERAFLHLPRP